MYFFTYFVAFVFWLLAIACVGLALIWAASMVIGILCLPLQALGFMLRAAGPKARYVDSAGRPMDREGHLLPPPPLTWAQRIGQRIAQRINAVVGSRRG